MLIYFFSFLSFVTWQPNILPSSLPTITTYLVDLVRNRRSFVQAKIATTSCLSSVISEATDEANMTMNPREKDFGAKKEDEGPDDHRSQLFPETTPSSSSRQWSSSFKNPRIVRVSRTFGGKDRHSKVCTVRGLRDRRIRLSVPTAIQLYDLQDRLGLSQPSKVIDWLLDATKHEIDKLPPLPMIPTNFLQFHQPSAALLANIHEPSPYNNVSEFLSPNLYKERERWIGIGSSQSDQENGDQGFGGFVAQNFFPLNSHQFSIPNLPYNSNYFQLDPPNLSLSQFGGGFSFSNRTDYQEHSNCSHASSSQIYTVPSITPPFPPYVENDRFREINHMQNVHENSVLMPPTLHLVNSPMKSFSLNASSLSLHSNENETEEQDKDNRSS